MALAFSLSPPIRGMSGYGMRAEQAMRKHWGLMPLPIRNSGKLISSALGGLVEARRRWPTRTVAAGLAASERRIVNPGVGGSSSSPAIISII
jgi:hypothetical protein